MKNKTTSASWKNKLILSSSSLMLGVSGFFTNAVHAQVSWEDDPAPLKKPSLLIWEPTSKSKQSKKSQTAWENVPESEEQKTDNRILWELLDSKEEIDNSTSTAAPNTAITPPSSLNEAEARLRTIPLKASDYKPLLNLSYAVPTANILEEGTWNLKASTISPFKFDSGTGNQNYAIRLDWGLTDKLQISGFYSEADDPLNVAITGLKSRPGNFWEVFGAALRWQILTSEKFSLALNSSLESWTVGSGGSDALAQNPGDQASPNIFNNSGQRVTTQNFVGSVALPITWKASKQWQFTLGPGISVLPSSQGANQGGAGEFYGTSPYISGGLLWHPTPQLGFTTSIAQPIGNGSNSFDKDLRYSKVPVISGGLNWHLNPRLALQGLLTNGFGATPATGLLTLPSDNRLGYSASFIFTTDAPDTPQPELTSRQHSLSLGGLTVNTALVPPNNTSVAKVSADEKGNIDTLIGYSLSNIFQLDFYRSKNNSIPQSTIQARTYANDGAVNLRGSGKAVLTSPLRGAPIWSSLRISLGRNVDIVNNSGEGYLFAETPLTWEANPKVAVNLNPKVAWAGVGTLWGAGISTNILLAPRWELISEVNIVLNALEENNGTLGLRLNATEDIAIEAYGSTAASIVDLGQLLNANQIRFGCRITVKF